jgi:catechol 2,3-dioxygenase-like lactoylglutathione lyase family enzyme
VTRAQTTGISPFFIVNDVSRSMAFYCNALGFEVTFQEPASDPFFAIVCRDGAQLFLKGPGEARPNPVRYDWARWDAFVQTPDPDGLAVEFIANDVSFSAPLEDTHDGLRGFELRDPDGHVLFFGRPR